MKFSVPFSCLLALLVPMVLAQVEPPENTLSPQTIEKITEQLQGVTGVEGRFQQRKVEAGFPRALESEGEFVYWRNAGVRWAVQMPFEQLVIYRKDKTLAQNTEDKSFETLGGRSEKVFRGILLDVLAFDTVQLSQQFDSQWSLEESGEWKLDLEPRSSVLRRGLVKLNMRGAERIAFLQIIYADGGSLKIHFVEQRDVNLTIGECGELFLYSEEHCLALTNP